MVGTLIASALGILQLAQLLGERRKPKHQDGTSPQPVRKNTGDASTDDATDR